MTNPNNSNKEINTTKEWLEEWVDSESETNKTESWLKDWSDQK